MTTIVDDTSARIARRLRLERDARGWSLADLAERAGVAKATISKIEREEMSPTAVILVRLAGAFDLTLAGLLTRAEGGERLVRAADQPVWRDPATGYRRTQVFGRPDHPVEIVEVEMPAGQRVVLPASSYAHIRQLVWVQKGELVITERGERHVLAKGDCLGFGPPAETVFANQSSAPVTYVVALARS
jgi:transcriptional regulator with XRE-family HTH domain